MHHDSRAQRAASSLPRLILVLDHQRRHLDQLIDPAGAAVGGCVGVAIAHSMCGGKIGGKWSAGKQRAAKMVRFCFSRKDLFVARKQLNKSALMADFEPFERRESS